jgi:hypothetical protein
MPIGLKLVQALDSFADVVLRQGLLDELELDKFEDVINSYLARHCS